MNSQIEDTNENTKKAEGAKKALGVGIFYLLGGILAVAPWPAIVPAVLLGSGMSLLVFHFLGGIGQNNQLKLTDGQKIAVQIGGASVILLVSSYYINFYLDKAKQNNLVVEPEPQNLLVLNERGEPVEVKTRRGLEAAQKLKLHEGDLRNVNLSVQYIDGRVFVRPSANNNQKLFFLGNIDNPAPNQTSPLTDFIYQVSENDYFNPTLVALRKSICTGGPCPNSLAGFPVLIKGDDKIKRKELSICVSNPDIAEAFALSSSDRDPSLYISSLYIAPSKNSLPNEFKELKISRISAKENVVKCIREKQKIIALVNPDDIKNWRNIPSKKINKIEMYAASQPP
jgi:hypothetical protein